MSYMKNIDQAKKLLRAIEDTAERTKDGDICYPVNNWVNRLRADIELADKWFKASRPDDR